jgi:beta-fructofuranosidase
MKTHTPFMLLILSLLQAACTAMSGPAPLFEKKNAVSDPAIIRAMEALEAAAKKVAGDPTRPVFHFRPPANWMNDPCGAIYYRGYYHLFYQLNPYDDVWARIHWGHAKSRDLVRWKHLPPALAPMENELRCNSGCVALNDLGRPMIFYTHVPNYDAPRDQRVAISDRDMITWERYPGNPILHLDTHGGPRFGGSGWDAPYVFREAGRSLMIIGADSLGSDRAVPIYEAVEPDFSRWQYKGLLFNISKKDLPNLEVPMFRRLGDRWLLTLSPGGPIVYWLGSFDPDTLTFAPKTEKMVFSPTRDLYAQHIFADNRDRCILLGWIRGFKGDRGWNGCMSLPRILSLDSDGRLRQRPLPALERLRTRHTALRNLQLDGVRTLEKPLPDTVEIAAVFEGRSAASFGIRLTGCDDSFAVSLGGGKINAAGVEAAVVSDGDPGITSLRIYLDRTVLEVFVNDGLQSISKVVYPGSGDIKLELFAENGIAVVKSLDVWRINAIWKD